MKEFIQQIARKGGSLILSADEDRMDTSEKTDARNVVTYYDEAVQALVFEAFADEIADITLLGEEAGLGATPSKGAFVVVDPIDGTSNFVKNIKRSAVSVAYGTDGIITHGCVYDPYLDEMFYAELNNGAYLNGVRIERNNELDLASSLVCFGTCPYDVEMSKEVFALAERIFRSSLDLRRTGCASLEMCYVAANRYDLFFESILYPWDYAASDLIVREAGGRAISFNEEPVSLQKRSSVVMGSSKAVADFLSIIRDMNLGKTV